MTLATPGDEQAIAAIEHVVGRRIPRRTLEGFNYADMPAGNLEVPIAERIAAIRAQKAGERTRARANAERRSRTGTPSRNGGGGAGSRPAAGAGYGAGAHRRSSNQRRGSGR
jgi:hypothetical protein